jgi:GNAT superfamily N-acetyltransferase
LQVFFAKIGFLFSQKSKLPCKCFKAKKLCKPGSQKNFIKTMPTIKEISSLDTFPIRHSVLRAGKPIESCRFTGDDLESTKHFGLLENKVLAGIITVLESRSELFGPEKQFQFRGMAVLAEHQKKGFGEQLLAAAENYARSKNGLLIWMNAREAAVGFYEQNGYKKAGNLFEIPGVGPHYMMYKSLRNDLIQNRIS